MAPEPVRRGLRVRRGSADRAAHTVDLQGGTHGGLHGSLDPRRLEVIADLRPESYLQDTWIAPSAADATAVDVHDAVTGETVCRASCQGLDLAGAFDHARHAGAPTLRALSFHRRADLLDALAAAVRARRPRAVRPVDPRRRHPRRRPLRRRRRYPCPA